MEDVTSCGRRVPRLAMAARCAAALAAVPVCGAAVGLYAIASGYPSPGRELLPSSMPTGDLPLCGWVGYKCDVSSSCYESYCASAVGTGWLRGFCASP